MGAEILAYKEKSEQMKAAEDARVATEKETRSEQQKWQSQGRRDIAAANAKIEKEAQKAEILAYKEKSEQMKAAEDAKVATEKETRSEQQKWQSQGRRDIAAA